MLKNGENIKKIKEIIKKVCTREIIFYAIFGVLTTAVNIGTFALMTKILKWNENTSNIIAIIIAVLFAYITNKDLVFHSKAKNIKEKTKEFIKFIAGRAFTMVVEFVGCFLMFKLPIPEIISKCIITVLVIILNFFISKFFAFKK